MTPAFDADKIAGYVATKHKANKADILEMWERNGDISRTFGTSLHSAMEQWFKFRDLGTAKEYHKTKMKYLQDAVATFPLRDCAMAPEVVVSDVASLRCGRVDALRIGPCCVDILDYKTDSDVDKKLNHHVLQLNYYRAILEAKGINVRSMQIWAYDGAWSLREIPRQKVV
jgi:hypothetical protein